MDLDDATRFFAPNLFSGHSVFVTGGGSGINLGIAETFAALGASVGICGRTPEKLERAAEKLSDAGAGAVWSSPCDVRDAHALGQVVDAAGEALGPIHTLVCGAAGNFPCAAEALSPNGFKAVVDIDLLGSFYAARAAFEQLKQTRGNVIFISAGQAMYAYAYQAHVGAAKAGVDQLMRNLALEWGPYGIRANSLAPGPIEGTEGAKRLVPPDSQAAISETIPLRRFGTVYEMGKAAAFLASPLASYVTGALLMADGGQNLAGSGELTRTWLKPRPAGG